MSPDDPNAGRAPTRARKRKPARKSRKPAIQRLSANDDRLLVTQPWRHYRRTYSRTEARWSAVVVVVLGAIAAWVVWRGANPDPALFSVSEQLLDKGSEWAPTERPVARLADTATGSEARAGAGPAAGDRGPVPEGLAADGWAETSVSHFPRERMYEKINGRADFYESFGVVGLHVASLARGAGDDGDGADPSQFPSQFVDLEMFDMGNVNNALGAYAGERQEDAVSELRDGTLGHRSRNALLLVRGRYYARAIGSDESPAVIAQLEHVAQVLDRALPAEDLPWSFAVFAGQLGLSPGAIGFVPENAFSFGFAHNVHTAQVNDDGAELFMVAATDQAAATALAGEFGEGFASLGEPAGTGNGKPGEGSAWTVKWVKDRYLGEIAGALHVGPVVVGIRGAPDAAFASDWLEKLVAAVSALPEGVTAQITNTTTSEAEGEYGAEDGDHEPGQAEEIIEE